MSAAQSASGRLWLAGRTVQAVKEKGAVRDSDLLTILDCDPAELRAAIGIAFRWRQIDRCGDYLVPAARRRERRRSA
jgi:hypothetical protein